MIITKKTKIFIAGHKGLVGSAIINFFKRKNYKNLITIDKSRLDLRDQLQTLKFLKNEKPAAVIIAAAKVGGIKSNIINHYEFLYENLLIQNNLIGGSLEAGVKNLIFLGSSCVYPRKSKQPIKESYLLSGSLEQTNESYSVAKIAGIKLVESIKKKFNINYKSLMPSNIYGNNDNFDLDTSHFYPAIIKKILLAKKNNIKNIELWGDGSPRRELLHADDIADACEFFLKTSTKESIINIGSGRDCSIKNYANFIKKILDYKKLRINFNNDKKLNGTPRKLLDISIAKKYGWKPKKSLKNGTLEVINHLLKTN